MAKASDITLNAFVWTWREFAVIGAAVAIVFLAAAWVGVERTRTERAAIEAGCVEAR